MAVSRSTAPKRAPIRQAAFPAGFLNKRAGRPRPCAAGEVPRPGTAGLEREGTIHRRSLIMIKSERAVRQGMSFDIGNADTLNSRRKASLYQIVSAPETRGNRAPPPLSCGCIPRWRFRRAQSLLRRDHFGNRRAVSMQRL